MRVRSDCLDPVGGSLLATNDVPVASKLPPTKGRHLILFALLALTACQQSPKALPHEPLVARLFLETRPGEAGITIRLPVSGVAVNVAAKPVLVEYDLRNAETARVDLGACLLLQVSPAAARDLYRLSVAATGRRLVLLLNDEPVGVHRIEQALADGAMLVYVERPDDELPAMVERLKRTTADIASAAAKK